MAGTSRNLVLVALGVAVAVVVAGGVFLVGPPGPGGAAPDGSAGDPSAEPTPLGAGSAGARRTPRGAPRAGEDEEEESGDFVLGPDGRPLPLEREPEGDVVVIDGDSLRAAIAAGQWEAVRYQIDKLQEIGTGVPEDVVRRLVELLGDEAQRIDATLALGQVRNDVAGKLLGELLADPAQPEEVRVAALRALAAGGQAAALAEVQRLVDGASADTPISRNALLALAGIGGPEAAGSLLKALEAHRQDDLTDVVATALARLRDGDAALAQHVRDARSAGDRDRIALMLVVGEKMGNAAGPALQREVRTLVESAAAIDALQLSGEDADRLRYHAIYSAARMGGEALDAVVQLVRSEGGRTQAVAVNALRGARGDASAEKVVALWSPDLDRAVRSELVAAAGATGSRVATPLVHAALDDPDGGVREVAAAALADLKDPASVPVILSKIDGTRGRADLARNYLRALQEIGVTDALPKLRELAASKDEFWVSQHLWVKRAIERIQDDDPARIGSAPR